MDEQLTDRLPEILTESVSDKDKGKKAEENLSHTFAFKTDRERTEESVIKAEAGGN